MRKLRPCKNSFKMLVNFEGINGSSLAFDGEQLIVTQTPRNIERLRTILRNYSEAKKLKLRLSS